MLELFLIGGIAPWDTFYVVPEHGNPAAGGPNAGSQWWAFQDGPDNIPDWLNLCGGGSLPLLTVHPDNPLTDAEGRRKPFARYAFDAFENIMSAHGVPHYVAEKRRLRAAVADGLTPGEYRKPGTRLGRLAMRIALRQLPHLPPQGADIGAWVKAFRT